MSARFSFRFAPALRALLMGVLALAPWAAASAACEKLGCVDEILTEAEGKGFAGAILVAEGDAIIFEKGYGKTALAGGAPITPETLFLIGSIVKDFTRLAALSLAAEKKLALDDTLPKFFPDVPADKAAITVRQLLDHTSGIPDLIGEGGVVIADYTVDYDYIPVARDEMVVKTLQAPLLFAPGSAKAYSNSGFSLLAAIVEIAAGKPFEIYVHERVFAPAGMLSTGYVVPDWSEKSFARGIVEGREWGTPLDDGRWMADGPSWNLRGNGGMVGTARDLHRFVRALAGNGAYPPGLVEAFLGPMDVSPRWNSRIFASAGSNGIFNAVFVWMADQNRSLVLITSNADHNGEEVYLRALLPYIFTRAEPAS